MTAEPSTAPQLPLRPGGRPLARRILAFAGVPFLSLLAPFLFNVDHRWSATIYYALPTPAYERLLVADPDPFGQLAFDGTVRGSWLAFAGWAVASVAVTVVMMSRRDQIGRAHV